MSEQATPKPMLKLGARTWLSSKELIGLYGLKATHQNSSRVAQRIVKDYNLPWYRETAKKWRTSDPAIMAMLQGFGES